jgi:hypothetical protein
MHTARHTRPACQENALDRAVHPRIASAAKPHLMAGSLEPRDRILGPVRDTAAFADNEYLHGLPRSGVCRVKDTAIR